MTEMFSIDGAYHPSDEYDDLPEFIKQKHLQQVKKNQRKIAIYEAKKKAQEEDIKISYDILKLVGGVSILDKTPPLYDCKKQYDKMAPCPSMSAITFTFKQSLRDCMDEGHLKSYLYKTLKVICYNFGCDLFPLLLLPDVDDKGNFHYHGLIQLPLKLIPKFKKQVTKHIGFMKISYLKDIEGWKNYCFKPELGYTDEELKKLSIYSI